jgi:hypothetical protein
LIVLGTSSRVSTNISSICTPASDSSRNAPCITDAKYGSSRTFASGSDRTTATAPVRRVTSDLAAWLGE